MIPNLKAKQKPAEDADCTEIWEKSQSAEAIAISAAWLSLLSFIRVIRGLASISESALRDLHHGA